MVDLHLITWNRPKMTELVIKTIARNTSSGSYRLVVWDNGSDEETQGLLDRLKGEYIHKLYRAKENVGLEEARDQLLKLEPTNNPYFVDVDNDCLPEPGWLPKLVDLMEKYEDCAAISLRTQVMIGTGNIFEETDVNGMPITDFPHPGGSFRVMRMSAVQKVGGWDRKAPGRGSEEKYICGKFRKAGYITGFATNVTCLHLFGDRAKTRERWGYDESMKPEESGHSDIWHPALNNGDSFEEVARYAGEELATEYFA